MQAAARKIEKKTGNNRKGAMISTPSIWAMGIGVRATYCGV